MGASLLAMRAAHPALMSADTPLSRASSLPQGLPRFAVQSLNQERCLQLTRALRTPSANAEHRLSTPSTACSGDVALAM
ncbi:hypothetical protein C1X65_15960 [Pseudomonas sp. FW305-70]|nr:hypothetical protein C1X65_15960 [Pseudomonas sp. FW305-70]